MTLQPMLLKTFWPSTKAGTSGTGAAPLHWQHQIYGLLRRQDVTYLGLSGCGGRAGLRPPAGGMAWRRPAQRRGGGRRLPRAG
jgi:hypothetical protein